MTSIVVIGGSAGSLEVLLNLLSDMHSLEHPVVLIMHRKASEDMLLESLFGARCQMEVVPVEDKTPLEPGKIFIAPSDYHLLFETDGTLALDTSEKINYSRPSIDLGFESAAEAFGKAVTGILLSGANADGSAGLEAIFRAGGYTVVQDPREALMPTMPQSAMDRFTPARVAATPELALIIKNGKI